MQRAWSCSTVPWKRLPMEMGLQLWSQATPKVQAGYKVQCGSLCSDRPFQHLKHFQFHLLCFRNGASFQHAEFRLDFLCPFLSPGGDTDLVRNVSLHHCKSMWRHRLASASQVSVLVIAAEQHALQTLCWELPLQYPTIQVTVSDTEGDLALFSCPTLGAKITVATM